MNIIIGDITFDARDVRALATFWAAALGYEVEDLAADFACLTSPGGRAPRCCFQLVEGTKHGKNRIHLDLYAADMDTEVARLKTLGAREVRRGREGQVLWTVMEDIEGNEFCVQSQQPGGPQL